MLLFVCTSKNSHLLSDESNKNKVASVSMAKPSTSNFQLYMKVEKETAKPYCRRTSDGIPDHSSTLRKGIDFDGQLYCYC